MTVGGTFVYVCENLCKDFELRVYNAVRYNAVFPVHTDDRVIMESQCIKQNKNCYIKHLKLMFFINRIKCDRTCLI